MLVFLLIITLGSPWRCDTSEFEEILVGINDMVVSPSGHVYLLDSRESRIFHLDDQGALVGSFGGRGKGPGEFGWSRDLDYVASRNQLVVIAHQESMLHFFDSRGAFLRSARVPDKARFQLLYVLDENQIIYIRSENPFSPDFKPEQGAAFVIADLETGRETEIYRHGNRYHNDPFVHRVENSAGSLDLYWMPDSTMTTFPNGRVLVGSTLEMAFRIYDGLRFQTVVEDDSLKPRVLTRTEIETYPAAIVINGKRVSAVDFEHPETAVPIREVHGDLDNRIWVRLSPPYDPEPGLFFRVYDRSSRFLGALEFPPGVAFYDADDSFVYIVREDHDEEERLIVEKKTYQLKK